jgi:hypothetical protein
MGHKTQFNTKFGDQNELEWANTYQRTIQKLLFWDFMDGMKLSHIGQFIWSLNLFFLVLLFSLAIFFP